MSLIVDVPKVCHGNSNDGNTARRAFSNPEVFADITGVNVECIRRLHNILLSVSSGYNINIDAFTKYCNDTLYLILELYDWYILPPTVHKLLVHGPHIASILELPLGFYSEEA